MFSECENLVFLSDSVRFLYLRIPSLLENGFVR